MIFNLFQQKIVLSTFANIMRQTAKKLSNKTKNQS